MKNSMRKIMIIIMVCSFFLINGCGEDSMSEEDLVDGRKMSGEQKLEEVEAGNFPLSGKAQAKKGSSFIRFPN